MPDTPMNSVGPFVRAAAFAAHHHRAQRRKGDGDIPYINHPLEVARILVDEGDIHDVDILMAAVLHDTVEDTEVTNADIVEIFGASVARYVAEVTDDKSLSKSERKRRQVMDAPTKSTGAKAIKLADKTSNLRDLVRNPPADWTRKRLRDYALWARQVGVGLRGTHPKLELVFDAALDAADAAFYMNEETESFSIHSKD